MNIRLLPGVGPKQLAAFNSKGVHTVRDLLNFFPRSWVIAPPIVSAGSLIEGDRASVAGTINSVCCNTRGRIPTITLNLVDSEGHTIRLKWFNQAYLRRQLRNGSCVVATGNVIRYNGELEIVNPRFIIADGSTNLLGQFNGGVYPATADLPSKTTKRIIQRALKAHANEIVELEYLGPTTRHRHTLAERPWAYNMIHNPSNARCLRSAKRRLKFDELFFMQLGLMLRQKDRMVSDAPRVKPDSCVGGNFPFDLTQSQQTCVCEIASDMASGRPMNRLLHGDVGSGKTAVAIEAMMLAVSAGYQVAVMAPTQILAEQLTSKIREFTPDWVRTGLLTSDISSTAQAHILSGCADGECNIAVGTTSLLSDKVDFYNPGLVVIDEQHKFGVNQRAKLGEDQNVHRLVMTATPIPRTIALSVFGDMDVSTIWKKPVGRGTVVTKVVEKSKLDKAMGVLERAVVDGRQTYVVCPRIDGDDGAEKVFEGLAAIGHSVGMVHGRMQPAQINRIIKAFRQDTVSILVSTTIIEVGVDIPNASLMIIMGADMFGLAQLHQLRGRIGRGSRTSTCLLVTGSYDAKTRKRLDVLEKCTDGFKIAEHDLKLRGPGDLFDTKQHGLPNFKLANIVDDFALMQEARKFAEHCVFGQHGEVTSDMRQEMEYFLGDASLGDVG